MAAVGEGVSTVCPDCGAVIEMATAVDESVPAAGDVSICLACRSLGVFTGNGLEVRRPTADELDMYLANPEVRKHVNAATLVSRLFR